MFISYFKSYKCHLRLILCGWVTFFHPQYAKEEQRELFSQKGFIKKSEETDDKTLMWDVVRQGSQTWTTKSGHKRLDTLEMHGDVERNEETQLDGTSDK